MYQYYHCDVLFFNQSSNIKSSLQNGGLTENKIKHTFVNRKRKKTVGKVQKKQTNLVLKSNKTAYKTYTKYLKVKD